MRTIQLWLPIIALVPAACSVNGGFSLPLRLGRTRGAASWRAPAGDLHFNPAPTVPIRSELWLPIAEARSMERPRSAEVEAALTAAGRSSN